MLTLDELLWALPRCWKPEEADLGGGPVLKANRGSPAQGQCIISSLVIKKHLGGDLMRATVGQQGWNTPHYFNQLENGMWIDSTRSQFSSRSPVRDIKRNPDPKLWEFKDTWQRVASLERRVLECLYSTYVSPTPLWMRQEESS